MRTVTVSISSILGGGVCVSATDGHRIYETIRRHVERGDRVALSFSGITRMTTAFLNAAVGQLYGEFPDQVVRKHLAPPIDAEPWHLVRLKIVVDRAKAYFANPKSVTAAIENATEMSDDEDL